MPTYVYRFVDTGETIEIQQSFTDPTLTEAVHPGTGAPMPVKKVFQPVGVTFKGDGFYKTDSRSGSKRSTASESSKGASTTDSPKADAPKPDTAAPPATKSETSSTTAS